MGEDKAGDKTREYKEKGEERQGDWGEEGEVLSLLFK